MTKSAIITGAADRVGRELALALTLAGYTCHIHYNSNVEKAQKLLKECNELRKDSHSIIKADLLNPTDLSFLVDEIARLSPDLLINNASLFEYDDLETFSPERMHRQMTVNYSAPVTLCLMYAKSLKTQSKLGHCVNIVDQKVINLNKDYCSYTLSKLALFSSLKYCAQVCAPNLRVNAVLPGLTLISGDLTEEEYLKARKVAALGESNTTADLVEAILYLDSAQKVSGQYLAVDGGQSLIPLDRDVAFHVRNL